MSGQDEEDKRAKQLEEARKRVEELKKKSKKNKKNKSKQKSSQEGSDQKEDSPQITSTDEGSPFISQSEVEDKASPAKSQLPQASAPLEEEEKPDLKSLDVDTDTGYTNDSAKSTEAQESFSNEQHIDENSQSGDKQYLERPNNEKPSAAEQDGETENVANLENSTLEQAQDINMDSRSGNNLPDNHTSELFSNDDNDETDFMSTIKKKNEQDQIEKLMEQLESSTAERKKLKFINMEQESTIEELQGQVEQLQLQLINCQDELQVVKTKLDGSEKKILQMEERTDISMTSPAPMKFAQFNTTTSAPERQNATAYSGGSITVNQPNIDRSALNKWRHWNVDMTTWRSIGSGPIVEF